MYYAAALILQTIVLIFTIGLSYGILTTKVKLLSENLKTLNNFFMNHLIRQKENEKNL